MSCLDDYRMTLKGREFLPLMVGGMGTNISTSDLVLAIEKLGGIAHLSDAMLPVVADKELGTDFTKQKTILLKKLRCLLNSSEAIRWSKAEYSQISK